MKNSPLVLIIPALGLCASSLCHAAPITWGTPTNTSGKADLIEGTVITALNGGNATLAISGGGASGTGDYNFAASNYTTITFVATGADAGDVARARTSENQYNPEVIQTTGDAGFDGLIASVTDANGTPSGIVTGTMTLDGLEIGTDYQIQIFFNDQRTTGATSADTRVMTYGDGTGNTIAVAGGDPELGVQTAHYGQFAIGTFTADAETQALTMDSSLTSGFGNVHYNAILVTGPEDVNVPPQLADATFDLPDGSPADTLVATLVATDGNAGDTLTYTITAGDPDGVFSLDMNSGELRTTGTIDVNDGAAYSLTVEVSDGAETDTAMIDINVFVPAGDAVITWGTAQNTSVVDDLVGGPVAFARNGGDTTVTVAGIDFESIDLGNGFFASVYGGGGITSTGDADFDTLISGFTYGGGSGAVELPGHITGLTPGQIYSVQVFYNDQRTGQSGRIMTVSDGQGNSADIGAGATLGTGEADDYGQFVVGTFVAEAPTQILQLAPGGAGFGNSHLTAILVVEGSGAEVAPRITAISFDPDTDTVEITWTSTPGAIYAIHYSVDLSNFEADITDDIDASAGEQTSFSFVLPVELIGLPDIFFRVETGG